MGTKQISVTFDFDPTTETVSNLTCFVDGVEKKKKTTRSTKKDETSVLENEAIITLEENKLSFNNKATSDMELEWKDRIIIKYEKLKEGVENKPMPLIGKDTSFDQEGSGNQFTKTNTVSCRGKANEILKQYGDKFIIEPYITKAYPEGVWKLVTKSGGSEVLSYEETVNKAEELDITILTDEGYEEDNEISEMTYKL